MKLAKLGQRIVMLARASANPNALPGGQTILDNTFPALVCDDFGILYTRAAVGGAGGITSGVPNTLSAFAAPLAGVKATCTIPGDASGNLAKIVIQSMTANMGNFADANAVGVIELLDDGSATTLWSATLIIPTNILGTYGPLVFPPNMGIPSLTGGGSVTFRFHAAPTANGFQSVGITGYYAK